MDPFALLLKLSGQSVDDNKTKKCDEADRALLAACEDGTLTGAKLQSLLLKNADIFTKAKNGDSALTLAVKAGSLDICKILVHHTIRIVNMANGQGNDRSALNLALKLKHTTIAKFLLEHRADVTRKGCNGDTALIHASRNNNIEIARELLSRGADINTQDRYGVTALHVAVYKGNAKTVKFLLDMKADATIVNKKNRTALQNAEKSSQRADVASILRDHHVNLGEGAEREVKVKEEREDEGDEDDDDGGVSGPPPLIPNSMLASARERVPTHAPIPALAYIPSSAFASAPPAPPSAFASVSVPVPAPVSAPFSVSVPVPVPVLAHVPAHVPAPETAPEAASKPVSIPVCVPVSAPFSVSTPTSLMGKRKRKTDSSAATPPRATDGGGDLVNLLLGMRTMTPGSGNATTSPASTKVKPTATTAARLRARRSTAGVGGASEIASILRGSGLEQMGMDTDDSGDHSSDKEALIDPNVALRTACEEGTLTDDLFQSLLAKSADVTKRAGNHDTALMLAVKANCLMACRLLIDNNPTVINMHCRQGSQFSPLIVAVRENNNDISALLINHHADVNWRDSTKETALMHAARNNNVGTARLLLARDAHINGQSRFDSTALHIAAFRGNTPMVRLLLEMRADTRLVNRKKKTALENIEHSSQRSEVAEILRCHAQKEVASGRNSTDEVSTFIARIANMTEHEATDAMLSACADGSLTQNQLNCLVERKADVFSRADNGDTTLMLAVKAGSFAACDALIRQKEELVNLGYTKLRQSVLILALRFKRTAIARLLIDRNADVMLSDHNEDTALIHAARTNNTEIANILVSVGVDINEKKGRGVTALNAAVYKGNVVMVKLLLAIKADPTILDETGKTALAIAEERGKENVVSVLKRSLSMLVAESTSGLNEGSSAGVQDDHHCEDNIDEVDPSNDECTDSTRTSCVYAGGDGIESVLLEMKATAALRCQRPKREPRKDYSNAALLQKNPNQGLLMASENGTLTDAMLQTLVERRADVSIKAVNGDSTLMLAVKCGSLSACSALVSHHVGLVNAGNSSSAYRSALILALKLGHSHIAKFLLERRANVHKKGAGQNTALIHAARTNNTEIARLLLAAGALINHQNGEGITALHTSANKGNVAMVSLLLEKKANTKLLTKSNYTALATAQRRGKTQVIKILRLHHSLDKKIKDGGSSARKSGGGKHARACIDDDEDPNNELLKACEDGSLTTPLLQSLLNKRADVCTKAVNDDTTLMLAVKSGSFTACEALVSHDPQVTRICSRQNNHRYPLVLAVYSDDTEIAQLLIDHRADVNRRGGANQQTALIHSARNNNTVIAKVLLAQRANINDQNGKGITALHAAAYKGNVAIVKLLLRMGADTTIVNKRNKTALENIEKSSQRVAVAELLRNYVHRPGMELNDESDDALEIQNNGINGSMSNGDGDHTMHPSQTHSHGDYHGSASHNTHIHSESNGTSHNSDDTSRNGYNPKTGNSNGNSKHNNNNIDNNDNNNNDNKYSNGSISVNGNNYNDGKSTSETGTKRKEKCRNDGNAEHSGDNHRSLNPNTFTHNQDYASPPALLPAKRKRSTKAAGDGDRASVDDTLSGTKRRKTSISECSGTNNAHEDTSNNENSSNESDQLELMRREVREVQETLKLRSQEGEKYESEVQSLKQNTTRLKQMIQIYQTTQHQDGDGVYEQSVVNECNQLREQWQSDIDAQAKQVEQQREEIKELKIVTQQQNDQIVLLSTQLEKERHDNSNRITDLTNQLHQQMKEDSDRLTVIKEQLDRERQDHRREMNEMITLRGELEDMKLFFKKMRDE